MVDKPFMRPDSDAVASSSKGLLERGNSDVEDPFRRAMPKLEVEPDVCSICLDEFTDDDPAISTKCGHNFHLQCVMQWAQRSRECPLCYKSLGLEDPGLHSMLPFGEYVKPEQPVNSALTDYNCMDMEQLLQHLTLQAYNGEQKRSRGRHRHRSTHLAQALEATRPSASIAVPARNPNQASSSSQQGYPGSWPPRNYGAKDSRPSHSKASSNVPPLRSNISADVQGASSETPRTPHETLKSKWNSFQAKLFGNKPSEVK